MTAAVVVVVLVVVVVVVAVAAVQWNKRSAAADPQRRGRQRRDVGGARAAARNVADAEQQYGEVSAAVQQSTVYAEAAPLARTGQDTTTVYAAFDTRGLAGGAKFLFYTRQVPLPGVFFHTDVVKH